MEAVGASRSAWAAAAAALEATKAAALKLASTVWLEATTRSTVPLAFWRIPMASWWLIRESKGWLSMARIWNQAASGIIIYKLLNLRNTIFEATVITLIKKTLFSKPALNLL